MLQRLIVCALILLGGSAADASGRSRADFARLLAGLKVGTPAADARKLLGPPDDVRGELDPGGLRTSRTREVWRYGTDRHLGTATLGQVYIDEQGRVQYVFGGKGTPPVGFADDELAGLLRVLGRTPTYQEGWAFDPRALIRAVNVLQPLGRGRAIAVVREYLRVSSSFDDSAREGMFLLLRALFDAPDGYPPMMVGAPSPPAPADAKAVPRFPLLILRDVPLLLVSGYMLGGMAERPEDDLAWFEQHGKLRAKPLAPTDQPLALAGELARTSAGWWPVGGGTDRVMIANQLLRLVNSIQRDQTDIYGLRFAPGLGAEARWEKLAAGFPGVKWDAQAQKYLRLDGSSLPDAPEVIHPRAVWRPSFGARTVVVLERVDDRFVRLEWRIVAGKRATPAVALEVVTAGAKPAKLTRLASTGASAGSEQVTGETLVLAAGTSVRVVLTTGAKSPIFTP